MSAPRQTVEQSYATGLRREVLQRPVFVGGVPGSGTGLVGARLLGLHHRIGATTPARLRFLTEPGGLCDRAAGRADSPVATPVRVAARWRGLRAPAGEFERRVLGQWYRQPSPRAPADGLAEGISREELVAALTDHGRHHEQDPVAAARILAADIIDPAVRSAGKIRWVDSTPANVRRAEDLYRIFPDMTLIHVVRDGRDVAAASLGGRASADDHIAALQRWADAVIGGYRAMLTIPLGRAHTVYVDQLFGSDGLAHYERMLDVLDIYDSPKMRAQWVRQCRRGGATSRWRSSRQAHDLVRIDRAYDEQLQRLVAEGVPAPQQV